MVMAADFEFRDERNNAFKAACRVARRLFRALEDDDAEPGPGTHRRLGRHSAVINSSAFGCTWRTDVIVTADCRLMLTLIVADPNGLISDEAGGGVRLLDPSRPFNELVDDASKWQVACLTVMVAAMAKAGLFAA
jgi:hypothetical protein